MPVTVLASFSLLALVVTARPLVTNPNDSRGFDAPGDVQNTVQSVFQSRVGQPANEQIRVHATSAEDQRAVLAELDALGAVKALVPPEDVQTEDEKRLFELVNGSNAEATPSLNDLDGGFAATTEGSEPKEPADWWSLATTFYETEPGRLVTLVFACAAVTLAVVVVAGLTHAKHLMTTGIRSLHVAYDVLPQVEKRTLPPANDSVLTEKPQPLLIDVPVPLPEAEGNVSEKVDLLDDYDSSSDSDDYNDRDEKFHDAESGQPHIVVDSCPDPDFLPLPLPVARSPTPYSTPPPSPPRALRRLPSQLQMREANLSASKPAWSLRAADAPALGLARSPSPSPAMRAASPVLVSRPPPSPSDLPSLPGSFGSDDEKEVVERPARRRAYRAPVPELDIAFALQMRPGLGLGSDPAWLVRFLMAMFGWMTVLIGGNGVRRQERWAITA